MSHSDSQTRALNRSHVVMSHPWDPKRKKKSRRSSVAQCVEVVVVLPCCRHAVLTFARVVLPPDSSCSALPVVTRARLPMPLATAVVLPAVARGLQRTYPPRGPLFPPLAFPLDAVVVVVGEAGEGGASLGVKAWPCCRRAHCQSKWCGHWATRPPSLSVCRQNRRCWKRVCWCDPR